MTMTGGEQDIPAVLADLLALYATIGIMAAGFGMMLGGPEKAASIARYFFIRPLVAVRGWALQALTFFWHGLMGLIVSGFALVWQQLARALSWLRSREAGWAEPYLRTVWKKIWP